MALPNDHTSEKIEVRELADIAERMDPVPEAVVEAARNAFRSRDKRHDPEVRVDGVVEAETNNDTS